MTDISYANGQLAKNKLREHGLGFTPPDRKPRCRKLDRYLNRCPGEEISEGVGLCASCLAQAHRDFLSLTGGRLSVLGGRS